MLNSPRVDGAVRIQRHDSTQESSQKIGSSYYAFFFSPDQDQIVVDDIIFRMFRLHFHATDHAAQWRAHIGYDDRTMPVYFRVIRHCIEQ
jgi:hypothetical protein